VARYGQAFKDRVVALVIARVLPPESAAADVVAREIGVTPATRQDRKRIKKMECELLRTGRALAETAALLVLSKKVAAIFPTGEGE